MTATLEPQTAAEVYVHALEPPVRGRARRLGVAALDLWCATFGGLFELSSAGDVVVRRRSDGVEELRIPAGPPDEASILLHHVREQLDLLSPDEFRGTWGVA
ncbi:MAG: hypothetical protein WB767_14020 [Nocardioides sp.]